MHQQKLEKKNPVVNLLEKAIQYSKKEVQQPELRGNKTVDEAKKV